MLRSLTLSHADVFDDTFNCVNKKSGAGRASAVSSSRISKASGISKLHEYGPSSRTAYRRVVEDSG
jgi:hypothetical protein